MEMPEAIYFILLQKEEHMGIINYMGHGNTSLELYFYIPFNSLF